MPLPSYQQLKKELMESRQMIAHLSTDPNYGIYTRPAIDVQLPRVKGEARFVAFLDIDDCKGLNQKYGYEAVNTKIRRCMRGVRHADILLRARWFSGDEIVVILRGDPEGFIARMRTAMKNQGISATFSQVPFSGNLENDVRTAAALAQAHKTGYMA